jgi:hypothetical protein
MFHEQGTTVIGNTIPIPALRYSVQSLTIAGRGECSLRGSPALWPVLVHSNELQLVEALPGASDPGPALGGPCHDLEYSS